MALANIIGGLGAILWLVGLLPTVQYAQAIHARAVTWYEQVTGQPSALASGGAV